MKLNAEVLIVLSVWGVVFGRTQSESMKSGSMRYREIEGIGKLKALGS